MFDDVPEEICFLTLGRSSLLLSSGHYEEGKKREGREEGRVGSESGDKK